MSDVEKKGRRVFISFLGLGTLFEKRPMSVPGYDELSYTVGNIPYSPTIFAQRTILEHIGIQTFDKVVLLMTAQSKERHRDLLVNELTAIGLDQNKLVEVDSISDSMTEIDQWSWFESLLEIIQNGDEVVFDFTHGFRSVPIIFSTAIGFVQKARKFKLLHAYYGYMKDKEKQIGELIDMANFYRINEWADGISQLVETADASKLAKLAEGESSNSSFKALNDPELIKALTDLTSIVKNIDVNHVAETADRAITIIQKKMELCSGADKQLLKMVEEKFGDLAASYPPSGKYDSAYFELQLKLIEMLNKHGLYMQAFTVMRECVGSIGMLAIAADDVRNQNDLRKLYAEAFLTANLLKCKWDHEAFCSIAEEDLIRLKSFTNDFHNRVISKNKAKSFIYKVKDIRNGFDHAWTSGNEAISDIETVANDESETLTEIIQKAIQEKIIPSSKEAK